MLKNWLGSAYLLIAICLLVGCTEEARKRLEPTPIAISTLNQLAVIADQEMWDGPVGDSIRYYFASAFPILPQPEPLFDLKHFTPAELESEPTRRELKAYLILADLSQNSSTTGDMIRTDLGPQKVDRALTDESYNVSVGKDKWASDQIIVYLFAPDKELLTQQVVNRFPTITKVIQKKYERQIDATVYLGGPDNIITNKVKDIVGISLKMPREYIVAVEQDNLIWLRNDRDEAINNLIISRFPYTSQSQFSTDNIISLRDQYGKALVSSTAQDSYMTTNDVDLPVVDQQIQLADSYAIEARGIWEMVGEFMGGPFLSYLVLDEKASEVIFIDAFVFAPGKRKRDYMLQLEHIVSSLEL
ncbi:MAG: DUF4837 family protein [Saprospiraceae bacterium]|nr:DUF4837 family protein [Saprospiraceae bacterium]